MAWRTEIYSGWGRALSATGDVARPERASALETLPAAPARGQGRSYGDACLNDAGRIIDMSRLDRILGFEGGLLHVEAGARLGEIARIFAPQGWLPPVMPGTGFATVGGAIANDVHGKNHHHAGTFGQHVSEITLRFQGKTKRLRPENPLFKATIGGLGQTGTIVAAKLKMTAIAGQAMQVRERRMAGWEEFVAELSSSLAPYSVGWIDATARGAALGRGILEEGEIAQASAPGAKKAKKAKKIPFNAPSIALAPPIVRAFNAAYLRRVPASGRTVMRAFDDFFFPLDRIHDWNRLYGKRGFHQFQCVVPMASEGALKDMLALIAGAGRASPLAVLKRLGPGRGGAMSFPMEGLTLAVDMPASQATEEIIARLEDMTLEAGGRIYLAKDALSSAATIDAMYPERAAWAATVAKADPAGALETDLTRRLELRRVP